MKKLLCLLLTLCLIAVPVTAFAGEAGDDTVYTLRVSTTRGDNTWFAEMYDNIFDELTEASNGRLQFEVFHNNTLGAPPDIWNMFLQGGIDILDMSPGMVGSFPVSEGFNVPFLFENDNQVMAAMNKLLEEGLLPEYSDNMELLTFLPGGGLELFTAKKPVTSMEELQGLKLRASSVTLSNAINAMGATAVSIQPSEQTTSLQQGVLDGVITGVPFSTWTGLGDVCKYLLRGNIGMSCMFCGMNKAKWESLPEDLQTLIKDTFKKTIDEYYMPQSIVEYDKAIDILTEQGVEIADMSEEMEAAIREATASFPEDYKASLGENGDAIMAIIEDAVANN